LLAGALLACLPAAAFDAATAEALIARHQAALVEVHATIAVKPELIEGPPGVAEMLGQQNEQEESLEAKGVVIDGSGVVAVPLAALDPTGLIGEALELDTPLGKLKIGMKSTLSAVKVITADGQEFPAEAIFKEPAAGLALLKLNTPPAAGLAAVDLAKDLPPTQAFARVLTLVRLGPDFGCAPTVRVMRIVQTTPPPFPLHDLSGPLSPPGTAAFDQQGRFLGLMVVPARKKQGGIPTISPMLLPTSEILRLGAKALP
jgi:hypothetical protein